MIGLTAMSKIICLIALFSTQAFADFENVHCAGHNGDGLVQADIRLDRQKESGGNEGSAALTPNINVTVGSVFTCTEECVQSRSVLMNIDGIEVSAEIGYTESGSEELRWYPIVKAKINGKTMSLSCFVKNERE